MSTHLGKCFLSLSAVQVVYVLLNKAHVPMQMTAFWNDDTLTHCMLNMYDILKTK